MDANIVYLILVPIIFALISLQYHDITKRIKFVHENQEEMKTNHRSFVRAVIELFVGTHPEHAPVVLEKLGPLIDDSKKGEK